MIRSKPGRGCPPWCEDREDAGERDHEMHFADLGSVQATHPDPPGTSATVVVTLVQDAHGDLATELSLLGDHPALAVLGPEAADALAHLLLEASGLAQRREPSDRRDEGDRTDITVLPPDRVTRLPQDQGC